ncbi:MAG: hypothetical protein IPM51_11585, partial [Sphingobacteriaceae bacterium]|nr:hypothetical protein [Sphingobacteriaceae bacterium]
NSESEILELESLYQYIKYLKPGESLLKVPAIGTRRKSITLQYINYIIHIPIWINPPWENIILNTGILNTDNIETRKSKLHFLPNTVHFIGPSGVTHRSDYAGYSVWSLDLNFKINPQGWNKKLELDIYDGNGFLIPNQGQFVWAELEPDPYLKNSFVTLFPYFFSTYGS